MEKNYMDGLIENTKRKGCNQAMVIRRYFFPILILTLLLSVVSSMPVNVNASDKMGKKKILILYSGHRGLPWHESVHKTMVEFFSRIPGLELGLEMEHLDLLRHQGEDYIRDLHLLFDKKHAKQKFHLIIAIDLPSLNFAVKARERLFPGTPVVFGMDQPDFKPVTPLTNVTGALLKERNSNYQTTLDLALKFHPGTSHVVFVGGTDKMSLRRLEKAEALLTSYGNRLKFTWLTNMPMDTILSKLKQLPENTIVFYIFLMQDSTGKKFIPKQACELIARSSNRPVYGFWDLLMGTGIVGGHMTSSRVLGTKVAEQGLRVLQKGDTQDIPIVEGGNLFFFDWKQLQRWNIKESDLPEESRVEFRVISFFEMYKIYILFGIFLVITESVLIFFLMVNRVKRLKVEQQLRDHRDHLEELVHERTVEIEKTNLELTDSKERYRSLSDAAFEGIIITEKGIIIESNNAAVTMSGYGAAELIGMDAIDLVAPDVREDILNKMLSDYEKPYETFGMRKNGTIFPIEVHVRVFSYKGRQVRVTAIRDLTEQKRAEEEIKTLQGILPICSFCKKIRDDKGYWNQVEVYVKERTDAQFSHGVCKECMKENYPKQYCKIYPGKENI